MNTTQRYSTSIDTVAVKNTVSGSDAISFGDFETGRVHVPVGSALTALAWHSSLSRDGAYLAVKDGSDSPVTSTVSAGGSYAFPAALLGARFIKITGNVVGDGAVVGVTLKD